MGLVGKLDRVEPGWTAETFLNSDLHISGDDWRYELVDGVVVAHAAPAPLHGVVAVNIAVALRSRMKGSVRECRECAPWAVVGRVERRRSRTPLGRGDRKRRDEQDVEGVQVIVEIYQSQASVHLYRKGTEGEWVFEAVDDMEGVLTLRSLGVELPLSEIYEGVDFAEAE